jgi:spermidine/putrescine transport system substrate-binding protein
VKKLIALAALALGNSPFVLADDLYLFNWNDYIAADTVTAFEQECKCKVIQDYFSSTEEMMAKLLAGASGYDIVIPTQNGVEALSKKGSLSKLDKSKLSNIGNAGKAFMDKDYDKGNQYSVPYAFTTTLIGYNETKLKELGINPADWAVIFDPKVLSKIKGKVTVMDDSEELFGAAMKYLGYSVNDKDEKHIKEAQQVIMTAKPFWAAFNSSSYIKELTLGNIWVAHGYSSDMFQARADALEAKRNFTVNFALPKQGAVLALDNMVIPTDAKHKALAHQFINFMLRPENAAALTNELGTGNPNAAALPFVNDEIKALTAIFPPADVQAKLETLSAKDAKTRRIYSKAWTEIKLN